MRNQTQNNSTQNTGNHSSQPNHCGFHIIYNQQSERGVALVVVLVLSAVALLIASALIYLTTTYTQVSGRHKEYVDACEASRACGALVMQLTETRGAPGPLANFTASVGGLDINFALVTPGTCSATAGGVTFTGIAAKLMQSSTIWTACNNSIDIDPNDAATYDMSAELGANSRYNCYGKVISNAPGNSGGSLGLRTKGVVSEGGEVPVGPIPYLYSIEVLAVKAANPAERCRYSILYQY